MLALAVALGPLAWAQDANELIDTYRRNFARSSLGTKVELLKEAAGYKDVNLGPLYHTAIEFVLNNSSLIGTDALMLEMAAFSVSMIKQSGYAEAADDLWSLFGIYRDTSIRVPILQALATVGKGNDSTVLELNAFLDSQVVLFKSGAQPDLAVMDAAIQAVGGLGDESSFPYLFAAYNAGAGRTISDRAAAAMASLEGDYASFLAGILRRGTLAEKLAALQAALRDGALQAENRAELSESALSAGLETQGSNAVDQKMLVDLRSQAARELAAQKWQRASPLAVKHFYDYQVMYNRGQLAKSDFLESIALLGAMGTQEAAQALSLYLQLINTETEQGKSYDEQITLAVVNNLGLLGDKNAFDYLLYIGYLQYPDSVKRAARDALQKLRW
ncbi:MAG: hypothetical protein KBB32_08380 [Spirochaetia bacterium]|nr:hypothetical protein [Spirochaetia bacterium]